MVDYVGAKKNLIGIPFVTVSSIGTSSPSVTLVNNGCDYGPDTPGTSTNGINEAIASGLPVRLTKGTFSISAAIVFTGSGQEIIGSGRDFTKIQMVASTNLDMVDINASYVEIMIKDLTFDHQGTLQSAGSIINIGYTGSGTNWRTTVDNCKLLNANVSGILNTASGGATSHELIFKYLDIESSGGVSVNVNGDDCHFTNVYIGSSGAQGFYDSGNDNHYYYCHVTSAASNAFQTATGNSTFFDGCIADTTGNNGFVIATTGCVLKGCFSYNSSQAAADTYNGLSISGTNCSIVGFVGTDSTSMVQYEIVETGGADYNTYAGTYLSGAQTALAHIIGSHSRWHGFNSIYSNSSGLSPSAGSASLTNIMMGLGSTITFTPSFTGRVKVIVMGTGTTATGASFFKIQPYHGSGSAPVNGVSLTGTADATNVAWKVSTTGGAVNWSFIYRVTGLTVGTAYWFDLSLATGATADSATISAVSIDIEEY